MRSMESLRGHLELVLLAIVSAEPSHGYAIIERARLLSEGVFDLGEGAAYSVLYRLERHGLLRSQWSEVGGRGRRVYHITRAGEQELTRLRAAWGRVANGMRAVLEAT